MKRMKTLRNCHEMVMNAQERFGTNSRKPQRYGHVHVPKTNELLFINQTMMRIVKIPFSI
jgi:hypothetical protein